MAGFSWRLTRTRSKQLTLAGCFLLSVSIAFLGKTDASLFDNFRAGLSDATGPVLSSARAPLVAVQNWAGSLAALFTVYDENLALKRENAELRKWQNAALSLENRLKRYEVLLNAVPDTNIPSVTARVVGQTSRPFVKTMILDTGASRDVKKGQAVVDERGLIGRVFVAGDHTSWVILLSDLNSRVPVVVEGSRRRAILAGDNTPAPRLDLDVGDNPVRVGDRVLSTGDGGVLPPDVPVGVVMDDGGALRVALYASPDATDYVRILNYTVPPLPPASAPGELAPQAAAPEPARTSTAALATPRPQQTLQNGIPSTGSDDAEPVEEDR